MKEDKINRFNVPNFSDEYMRDKYGDFREVRNLREYKEMSVDELMKEKEKIEKEIFRRLGS